MKRNRLAFLIGLLVLLSIINLALMRRYTGRLAARSGRVTGPPPPLYQDVAGKIMDNYVEEVDPQKLMYGAIRGMVSSLNDRHSSFMEPDAFRHMREDTNGEFGGLGVMITMREGLLTVESLFPGKAAEKAGIEKGDKIVKINGVSTRGIDPVEAVKRLHLGADPGAIGKLLGITLPEAVNKLRGEVGTKVTITVLRKDKEKDIEVTRERISVKSVLDVKVLDEKIGYVRITDFRGETPRELSKALGKLQSEGALALILDLRGNPGGLLDSAVDVADRFIADGNMIVYTEARDKDENITKIAGDKSPYEKIPMVVLIDKFSASGSEIVAGAIQDWGRGVLLGEKTYGKGSVQNLIPMRDGSALRLTTARYHSPKGRVIDKKGIIPDVVVEPAKGGDEEESEPPDVQLERAKEILKASRILKNI